MAKKRINTKITEHLPKKNNASNGKKAHYDDTHYLIGRIRYNSWASKILPARDIYIYESDLVHFKLHIQELANIGMTQFDFAKYVIDNFTEIREGTGNSYLLIVRRTHVSNLAAIELTKEDKLDVYKIKTAYAVTNRKLKSKKLLLTNDH